MEILMWLVLFLLGIVWAGLTLLVVLILIDVFVKWIADLILEDG